MKIIELVKVKTLKFEIILLVSIYFDEGKQFEKFSSVINFETEIYSESLLKFKILRKVKLATKSKNYNLNFLVMKSIIRMKIPVNE